MKEKEIHFVLQGKGGVGKSFISLLLIQYLQEKNNGKTIGFDTDPVNSTFSKIRALDINTINILDAHKKINTAVFDGLITYLVEGDQQYAVIDNGSATFVPLMFYLMEGAVFEILKMNHFKIFIHIPIVGGQAASDTLESAQEILENLDAQVVLWQNDFQGSATNIETLLNQYKNKILGVIHLPDRNPDTFGQDLRTMTQNNLTFKEVATHPLFNIMSRHRLKSVQNDVFTQLDTVLGETNHELPIEENTDKSE
ncbi:hypothetical protein [Brackiella oedipodis]|uniref:nucleotide-binding protein n=1 Tax=Brackiella oedipodis TaxID=124225 RepID=UPI00056DF644|nr:hypothetical protein [Brackiella oedipodis]